MLRFQFGFRLFCGNLYYFTRRSNGWKCCDPDRHTVEKQGGKCNYILQPDHGCSIIPDVLVQTAARKNNGTNSFHINCQKKS